ncbi:MAG: tandem-95 repeat protein [Firmicutes bacterium]|nr:tandem-95 repeat protein [Bacillota bacterium]
MERGRVLRKRIILKLLLLGVLILHTAVVGAAPQDFSFATPVFYPVGAQPFIIKTADFNGDGILDLVTSNSESNDVSILLGRGDGTFEPQVRYATGSTPMGMAIGDFNGDGKPDLAVANRYSYNVSILKGNGDGTFEHLGFFTVGTEPVNVATGDFNADQKLDLAVANIAGNSISILLGKGDGTFHSQTQYSTGNEPISILTADFNLDGKLDIAVANCYSRTRQSNVAVLLGNGDGTFTASQYYAVGFNPRLAAADFNGDGIPDFVSASAGANNVLVFIGRGDGTFEAQGTYSVGSGPMYIESGDFDGDGLLDLVTVNRFASYISILPGKGDGTFLPQITFGSGPYPFSIAVGDFNRDGKKDLAVINFDQHGFGVLINTNTTQVNLPPVLAPISDQTADQGQLLQLIIRASDPNDDPLIFSAHNLPEGAAFDPETQVFSWIPGYTQSGDFTVRFEVSDGRLTASREVVITVRKVNLPPVFDPIGNQTVNEGELLEFTVSATDPNEDPLTYSVASLPAGAVFDPATRVFSWSPDYTQAGVYTVVFHVSDGSLTDSIEVKITVNQVNRPPVLEVIDNHWVDEGQILEFTINAIDPDGDLLTYSVTGLPEGAGFDPAARLFSWTPDYGQAGTYMVTFQVNDGQITVARDVYIVVNQVNRAPVLEEIGDQIVNEGQLLEFTVAAVDPDGDELTYTATGLPEGASFDPTTRVFSWTPSYAQAGIYTVTFQVSDGGLTDSIEVKITVNQVNRAPEFESIVDQIVNEGQLLEFTVAAVDPDGDELTYTATGLPEGAGFDPTTRVFSWTPSYAQAGAYTVTFQVSDGGLTDSIEVKITVNQVNRAPEFESIVDQIVNEGQLLEFTVAAVDPDGDELTYTATGLPEGAGFDPTTRVFSWTPSYAQAGIYEVLFEATDGLLKGQAIVNITVNEGADPDIMMIKALIEKLIRLIEKSKLPGQLKSMIISELRKLLDYEFTKADLNKIKALLNLIKAQDGKKISGEVNATIKSLMEKIDRFHDRWDKEKHKDHNCKKDKDKPEEKDPKPKKEDKHDHKHDKDKHEEKDQKHDHNRDNKHDPKGDKDGHHDKDQKQAEKDQPGKNKGKK